jgi:hypothetical protein
MQAPKKCDCAIQIKQVSPVFLIRPDVCEQNRGYNRWLEDYLLIRAVFSFFS